MRSWLTVLVLALVFLTGATNEIAAAAPPPHLAWADCGGGFQCATAIVPRDYDNTHGPTFALPVIKWPAKDQAHKIGALYLGISYGGQIGATYAAYDLPQNDVFRGPFTNPPTAAPVLVIAGAHDPAAPYRWGRRLAEQLGNARLLTYKSEGHGSVTEFNPCITAAMFAYLDAVALPAAGASCTQGVDPFGAGLRAGSARWRLPVLDSPPDLP